MMPNSTSANGPCGLMTANDTFWNRMLPIATFFATAVR